MERVIRTKTLEALVFGLSSTKLNLKRGCKNRTVDDSMKTNIFDRTNSVIG